MPFNLDWATVGANGSYSLADGADSVGVTLTTVANALGQTATAQTQGDPAAPALWVSGLTEPVITTMTFAAPVSNFSFDIYDIDSEAGGWDDKLTVLVTDAQGNVQAVNFGDLLADPYHSANGNELNADGSFNGGVETIGAEDSVSITIAGPVSQIQFIFDNGESVDNSGMFGVGNMSFSRAAPDFIVEGTAGDDLIDDAYLLDPEGDRINSNDAADGSNDDYVLAGAGNDTVLSGAGDDSVVGEDGDDSLIGGEGNDTLVGDFENDNDFSVRSNPVAGPGGADVLEGGGGNDSLYGGSGDDSLYGGEGDDSLLGGHGNDLLEGGDGNDDLEGLYGDDTIYGGAGNDHVFGRDGADLIYGGDGVDTLVGSIGIDTIYGGAGNDILAGSQGSDLIYGGEGDDLVFIGVPAAGDIAYDNEGTVYLDAGNDFLDGGDATLRFEAYGGEGNDLINAGIGADTLFGGADNDQIYAGAGDDTLSGDEGDDYIEGQSGDDKFELADGFGRDTLVGGETGETNGDTLDASAITSDIVLDLSAGDATNPEDGTLTVDPTGGAGASPAVHYVRVFKPDAPIGGAGGFPSAGIDFSAGQWFYVPVFDFDNMLDDSDGATIDTSQNLMADLDGLAVGGSLLGAAGKAEYLDANGNPFFVGWVDDNINGATGIPANTYLIVSDAAGAEPAGLATSTGLQDSNGQFTYNSFTAPVHIADFSEIETVMLGSGNDQVLGSDGDDVVFTGAGADTVTGGAGNDQFDLGAADGAEDWVVLGDGSGNDTITNFEGPIDNGDGTYTSQDLLDVSNLLDAGGNPVDASDVVVTDTNGDGTGDAILTFPNGESVTLTGVPAASLPNAASLEAIGIPLPVGNGIVDGTAGDDTIVPGYLDADGDWVDGNDNALGNDDDVIMAGDGNDSVNASFGDDEVYGGAGNDTLAGGDGTNQLYGGQGDDVFIAGSGADSFDGGSGQDNLDVSAATTGVNIDLDSGVMSGDLVGDDTLGFGVDGVIGSGFDDTLRGFDGFDATHTNQLFGGAGNDLLDGRGGDDQLYGGSGNDTLIGGAGNDLMQGGTGADSFTLTAGNDTVDGGDDADVITVTSPGGAAGPVAISVDGGTGGVDSDTLNLSGYVSFSNLVQSLDADGNSSSGTVDVLDALGNTVTVTFTEIERLLLPSAAPNFIVEGTAGADVIDAAYLGDPEGDRVDAGDNLAGNDDDLILAGAGNDTVDAGEGADTVLGEGGDDILNGAAGNDMLDGGIGADTLDGGADADTLMGGGGNDTAFGGTGDDVVAGGSGDDVLSGGVGADTLFGGSGSDTIGGNDDNDLIYGGGSDTDPQTTVFWMNDSSNNLLRIDTVEGNATTTIVGNTGQLFGDVGMSPNGTLYGVTMGSSGLFSIDTTTGASTSVGAFPSNIFGANSLSFDENGTGYTASGSTIYQFNPANPAGATAWWTDPAGGTPAGDYIFIGNKALISWNIAGQARLVELNLAPDNTVLGHQTLGVLPFSSYGLTVDAAGQVYVAGTGAGGNAAYRLSLPDTPIDGGAGAIPTTLVPGSQAPVGQYFGATSNVEAQVGAWTDTGDSLSGGAGNDTVYGMDGADTIDGGIGADALYGGSDDDSLRGDAGADTLFGGRGADTLMGGADNDSLMGETGDDSLLGEDGNDTLNGGDGLDLLDGGLGNDSLLGGVGNDTLLGDAGDDTLLGGVGDDVLYGGNGADLFNGGADADIIYGGAGDVVDGGEAVTTGADDDTLYVTGVDFVTYDASNDENGVVTFIGGGTLNFFNIENLYLDGVLQGTDEIVNGTSGDDTIEAGWTVDPDGDEVDGNDNSAGNNDDHIRGNGGNDSIYAGDGNDLVYGGADSDIISGDVGNDTLFGDEGDDWVYGGAGNDTLDGGTGQDTLAGDSGDDTFTLTDASAGNDQITGGETGETVGDTLDASAVTGDVTLDLFNGFSANPESGTLAMGSDTVNFQEIENIVLGSGDDSVRGSSGNDTVSTGAGADTVNGGAGNDTFNIGPADGAQDVVVLANGGGSDTITGFEGPTLAGGVYTGLDQLNVAGLTDGSSQPVDTSDVTVTDTNGDGTGNAILTFPDGTSVTLNGVTPPATNVPAWLQAMGIPAAAGPDYIVEGTAGADLIDAGYLGDPEGDRVDANDNLAGNNDDVIEAGSGNDTVFAGAGNDFVDAGTGDDSVSGGAGDDTINGMDGNDTLTGGEGNDLLAGSIGDDSLVGGAGNDGLAGGFGNDTLSGDSGNDTLYGNQGSDTLFGGTGNDYLDGGEDADSLDGGAGDDSILGGSGNDTIIGFEGSDTVDGGDGDDLINTRTSVGMGLPDVGLVHPINPALSYGADTDPNNDRDSVLGGAGNDTILTGDDDDTIYGGVGSDSIEAGFDDDLVYGGADFDTIEGSEGADTIYGDDGADLIYGGLNPANPDFAVSSLYDLTDDIDPAPLNNADSLFGGTGNDTIYGFDDADTLDGGDGNDLLYGGIDNDSLSGGAGGDTLHGDQGSDTIAGGDGADSLYGGIGNDLLNTGLGDDAAYGGDGNDTIIGGGTGIDALFGDAGNDSITGSLTGNTLAYGGDGNDTITGGNLTDQLIGDAGADVIYGGGGADVMEGDAGNDSLYGGDGADSLYGGDDRDFFVGGIGDVIDGGEGGDDFDRLNLANLGGAAMTNIIYGGGNDEAGTVEVLDAPGGSVIGSFTFANIESVIPCFTPGTMILTNRGERLVEDLVAGDKVLTRDNGYRPIRWIGKRVLSNHDLAAQPAFNPVRIRAGALGDGLPARDMTVSPQHRMLISGTRAEMLFGEHEVLVSALHMVNDRSIVRAWPQSVTYIHILFDEHEIVRGDGAWTESFQPGDQTLQGMDEAQRAEVLALFPQLEHGSLYPAARMSLKAFEAKALLGD